MTNAQPEPSMEEILASIRRIISEDEEDGVESAQSAVTKKEPRASVTQVPKAPPPAAVEAVQATQPEPVEPSEDLAEEHLETEDVEMVKKEVVKIVKKDDGMLGENSAAAATKAFQNLSQTIRVSDGPSKTIEDIVMELLQPMVKDWLDANLPAIVEEKVEEEVQRVARRRG